MAVKRETKGERMGGSGCACEKKSGSVCREYVPGHGC